MLLSPTLDYTERIKPKDMKTSSQNQKRKEWRDNLSGKSN
jgi:hypothetical protein